MMLEAQESNAPVRISRREAIFAGVGTLIAVVAHAGQNGKASQTSLLSNTLGERRVHPFRSGRWAFVKDVAGMGDGASFSEMEDQLSEFFGNLTGKYLADVLIYPHMENPSWSFHRRPIYEQFKSIYRRGWTELDATLVDGRRMVSKTYDGYRAATVVGEEGVLQAAALTFDFSPLGGVTNIVRGRRVPGKSLWPFSTVLFQQQRFPDTGIYNALHGYIKNMPLEDIRREAGEMSSNGKVKIKVFFRTV